MFLYLDEDQLIQRDKLVTLAEQLNLESFHLDDYVHDAASQIGSSVNNRGLPTQIEFLLEEWGYDEVSRILRGTTDG